MEEKDFITEREQTHMSKSCGSWDATTYVKVKGYCYMINTLKTYSGDIVSSARQVNDEGSDGNFRAVSFDMFGGKQWNLGRVKATATEAKIKELHLKALNDFDAMADELPGKAQAYEIKPGQLLACYGYGMEGQPRKVVYKVEGKHYFWVDTETLHIGQDNLGFLKSVKEKFGIGHYYIPNAIMPQQDLENLVLDAFEKKRKDEEERPAREMAAKVEREMQIDALIEKFPYLIQCDKKGGGVHVAKNIRIELKRTFPNQTFRVTSDYSSVRVRWTDGPATKAVKEIIDKYEDHATDISGDFRDYSPSLFNEVFGGCNYVFEKRDHSPETWEKIQAWCSEKFSDEYSANREARKLFNDNEIPRGPWYIGREEHEHGYCIIAEQAEQPLTRQQKQPAQTTEGITIRRNTEKNGIEIIFDSKPDDDVLAALKKNGFRWSKFQKLWWAKHTPEQWAFAQSLNPITA